MTSNGDRISLNSKPSSCIGKSGTFVSLVDHFPNYVFQISRFTYGKRHTDRSMFILLHRDPGYRCNNYSVGICSLKPLVVCSEESLNIAVGVSLSNCKGPS
jgi:hypothetical protein